MTRDDRSAIARGSRSESDRRSPPPDRFDAARLARLVWSELPLLAVVDLLAGLAAAVVAVTALSVAPLAPVVAAVLLGPVWIGAVACCDRLVAGDPCGIRDLLREIRCRARTGIALAIVPAAAAALLLGSIRILTVRDGQRWMLAPIAVDATVLIVLACGCLTVFPLAVATELRGRERWFAAIGLAGQNLTASLGIVALAILLLLSVRFIGPFLAFSMVGPFCLLITATARAAITTSSRRRAIPENGD